MSCQVTAPDPGMAVATREFSIPPERDTPKETHVPDWEVDTVAATCVAFNNQDTEVKEDS